MQMYSVWKKLLFDEIDLYFMKTQTGCYKINQPHNNKKFILQLIIYITLYIIHTTLS